MEENNSIAYLDTRITRTTEGNVHFSFYRKPTSNDRHLDYNSIIPISYKCNSTLTPQRRAFTRCSDEASKTDDFRRVRQDLSSNAYTDRLNINR